MINLLIWKMSSKMKSTQARDSWTLPWTHLCSQRGKWPNNPSKVICSRLNTVLLIIFLWMNRKRSVWALPKLQNFINQSSLEVQFHGLFHLVKLRKVFNSMKNRTKSLGQSTLIKVSFSCHQYPSSRIQRKPTKAIYFWKSSFYIATYQRTQEFMVFPIWSFEFCGFEVWIRS